MTSSTVKDLNDIFQITPCFISNTWQDLPECFKLSFETHYGRLIDIIPNIYSSGRECLYFAAYWEDCAFIGYQPSQCLAPSEPKIVFLRKGPCSKIQIEEISLCTAKEFVNFLMGIFEKGNANNATEEDKNSLSHILPQFCGAKLTTSEGARWYFEKFKDIAYQKSHHSGELFQKDPSQAKLGKKKVRNMEIIITSAVISTAFTTIFLLAYFL